MSQTGEPPRATLSIKTKSGIPTLVTITNAMTAKEVDDLFDLIEAGDMAATNRQMGPDAKINAIKASVAPVQQELGVCPKCGAPNARSLKGKIYCSKKCWLETTY